MANACRICATPAWTEKAGQWAREGVSDREVARCLAIDKSLVTRHRENHVIRPLRNQLAVASTGRPAPTGAEGPCRGGSFRRPVTRAEGAVESAAVAPMKSLRDCMLSSPYSWFAFEVYVTI